MAFAAAKCTFNGKEVDCSSVMNGSNDSGSEVGGAASADFTSTQREMQLQFKNDIEKMNKEVGEAQDETMRDFEKQLGDMQKKQNALLKFGIVGFVIFFVFGIAALVFWIMMIVHAMKHDIKDKTMWLILMIFTGIIGALIYYFTVKRNFVEKSSS